LRSEIGRVEPLLGFLLPGAEAPARHILGRGCDGGHCVLTVNRLGSETVLIIVTMSAYIDYGFTARAGAAVQKENQTV